MRKQGTHSWARSAKLRSNLRGEVRVKRTISRVTDFRIVYKGSPLTTPSRSPVARVYVERRPSSARAARD
jgi:hypothetical protein